MSTSEATLRQTNLKPRFILNRIINFVRPRPRYIPLKVDELVNSKAAHSVTEQFTHLYYSSGVARNLNWKGIEVLKNPCDLWMALELMQELKPSVILETGTHFGGSALFFADMAKVFGLETKVITIDYNPKWAVSPEAHNIDSVIGYSTTPSVYERVKTTVEETLAKRPGHVLAFLDSDHSEANVLAELRLYSQLITVGSYLVVEDTLVNGHPTFAEHGPGPWEAAHAFLKENDSFTVDLERQRFLLTYNPEGWLKRIK